MLIGTTAERPNGSTARFTFRSPSRKRSHSLTDLACGCRSIPSIRTSTWPSLTTFFPATAGAADEWPGSFTMSSSHSRSRTASRGVSGASINRQSFWRRPWRLRYLPPTTAASLTKVSDSKVRFKVALVKLSMVESTANLMVSPSLTAMALDASHRVLSSCLTSR